MNRLRQRIIRPLSQCDVMRDPIISDNSSTLFDAVASSLCLEAACPTLNDFKSSIERIASMIKMEGYLFLVTVLGETFYRFDDTTFPCLKLEKVDVEQSLEEAGFTVVKSFHLPVERNTMESSDFDGVLVSLSKKIA